MSQHTCIEPPNQAAIAYRMQLDLHLAYPRGVMTHKRWLDENPKVTTTRRLWPLAGMCFFREWAGIILTHGQGR
jgi:hypothetical protein